MVAYIKLSSMRKLLSIFRWDNYSSFSFLILSFWLALPSYGSCAEISDDGEQSSLWARLIDDITQTINQPENIDFYIPFISWHNRFLYDREKTDIYNELPWGGGVGVSRDTNGVNWSSLYMMIFKDSHKEWQPIAGYAWEKGWNLDRREKFRAGLGFTAGITARRDFANYVPLPIILPIFSASYSKVNIQFTYIPGTYNNGNVLFGWLRYSF